MKKTLFGTILIFSIVLSTNPALARLYEENFCPPYPAHVPVGFNVNYGTTEYLNDLRNSKFSKYLARELEIKKELSMNVRGLTVAQTALKIEGKAEVLQSGNKFCVQLSSIDMDFGYERIIVLVDRKYRPNSCEYKAVKDHEDTHVYLNRDVLRSYAYRIKKKAEEAARQVLPQIEYSRETAEKALKNMVKQVEDAVMVEVNAFDAMKEARNQAIDTEASYASVTEECSNW